MRVVRWRMLWITRAKTVVLVLYVVEDKRKIDIHHDDIHHDDDTNEVKFSSLEDLVMLQTLMHGERHLHLHHVMSPSASQSVSTSII